MIPALSRRPRVIDVAPDVRQEQGPAWPARPQAVAVVAHWSHDRHVSRSVEVLLQELMAAGYTCALVSTSAAPTRLTFREASLSRSVSVFRRPNIGYDFGSWASFLHTHPQIRTADRVLLANDSLLGPFGSLAPILQGFEDCPADIWGLTSTTQDWPHLQSHFVGYKDAALDTPAMRAFWRDVRIERSKRALILRYEIGLTRFAQKGRLLLAAHFPWYWVTAYGQNPTSAGWRRLLGYGFPFVKRELVLRPPPEVVDAGDVAAVVHNRWQENVHDWV